MSKVLTTEKLIASVRRRAMIPDDTSTFTDDDIIDIMNEELVEQVLSDVMVTNEEHLVYSQDEDTVADNTRYKIPYRAVGNKLRDIAYLDSSDQQYEMSRISLEELSDYSASYTQNGRDVFWVQGADINVLAIRLNDYAKLRYYYYMNPSSLVKADKIGVIAGIDRSTGVITLSNFPVDFANEPVMDFVGNRAPSSIKCIDKKPTSVSSSVKTVTFAIADIPADLIVGDYLCKREESPVPNLPSEFHPIVAQVTAIFILESMGDTEGLSNANAKLVKMKESIIQITSDRVEGSPQKVNPRHTPLVQTSSYGSRRKGRL